MNPTVGSNFQDWEPVIISKPVKKTEIKNKNDIPVKTKQERELEGDEIVKPKKMTLNTQKAIQQARLANKMSQKQLAAALNVPVQTISSYESGKAIPNNQFISKLERALKTKIPRK